MNYPVMNIFHGFVCPFVVYTHQYLRGLNPFPQLLPTPGVYSRLQTAEAWQSSMIQRSQRRYRNKQIGTNICLLITRMAAEESRNELEQTCKERDMWKADAIEHFAELKKAAMKVRDLDNALNIAREDVKIVEKQSEELCSMVRKERSKAEAAETCRQVAIASLRNRWQNEKAKYAGAVQTLDGMLKRQEAELREMKTFVDESVEHIEWLEQKLVTYEKGKMIKNVSRQLSLALSDIRKVGFARPDDRQSVGDKMRDLRDGVADIVKEVRSRRENSTRMQERIFKMEEERLMWEFEYTKHGKEREELVRLLHEANSVIRGLRGGQGRAVDCCT